MVKTRGRNKIGRSEGEGVSEEEILIRSSPVVGRNEEQEDTERGSTSESRGSEEPLQPLQPLRMYFPHSEYMKKIKLGTRCFIAEALEILDNLDYPLSREEREWFEEHPQFKHIFHMPREKNHKVMGMWMLLLRTAEIEKKKEAWFVVNGTPIRYGIKEHALISGFNCCNYPVNYKKAGSDAFKNMYFKGKKTIRYEDVKTKLKEMVPVNRSRDRLKMAVLFFLFSIVIAQTKSTGKDASPVDNLFVRAVGDLNFCKTFPWGRYSFDFMLKEIKHTMSHFQGTVKGTLWPVPGFCIPMEILAFEAIPDLGNKFLEDYPGADENCPRMCKRRFKKGESKGFPLSEIYKALVTTVDIDSILPVRDEEISLMAEITEVEDDDDEHDVVVASWMHCISKGLTISVDEMYNQDVATRREEETQEEETQEEETQEEEEPLDAATMDDPHPTYKDLADLVKLVTNLEQDFRSQMQFIVEKVNYLEAAVNEVQVCVKEVQESVKEVQGSVKNLEKEKEKVTAVPAGEGKGVSIDPSVEPTATCTDTADEPTATSIEPGEAENAENAEANAENAEANAENAANEDGEEGKKGVKRGALEVNLTKRVTRSTKRKLV